MPTHAVNEELEGKDMDPSLTKVVDRRWYEKNKHIFPASLWKEYEAGAGFEACTVKKRCARKRVLLFMISRDLQDRHTRGNSFLTKMQAAMKIQFQQHQVGSPERIGKEPSTTLPAA